MLLLLLLYICVCVSKTLNDYFADAPLCATDKVVIVGAFRNENLNIYCEVQADPPPRFVLTYFIWFNVTKNKGKGNTMLHRTIVHKSKQTDRQMPVTIIMQDETWFLFNLIRSVLIILV